MAVQTNHIVAAFSQLEVDNYSLSAFLSTVLDFVEAVNANNKVVYNQRCAVTLSVSQTLLSTNGFVYAPRIQLFATSCRTAMLPYW